MNLDDIISPPNVLHGMHFLGMKVVDDNRLRGVANQGLADQLNVARDAQREDKFERADEILREAIKVHPAHCLPYEVLCPLSVRGGRVISNAGIHTLADVLRCDLTTVEGWKGFGDVSKAILGERLRELGLNLSKQEDHRWVPSLPVARHGRKQRLDRVRLLPVFVHLRVWTNGIDTVVAKDFDDVRTIVAEYRGADALGDPRRWQPCGYDCLTIESMNPTGAPTTKTMDEWIMSEGRGLLCSTDPVER